MPSQRPTDYFFSLPPNFIDDSLLFIVLLAKNELNFDVTEAAVLAAKRNDNVQRNDLSMLLLHAVVFCFCKEHQKLCWPSVLNICPRGKLAFVNTLGSFYFYTFFPVVGGGQSERRECVSWSISTLLEHKSSAPLLAGMVQYKWWLGKEETSSCEKEEETSYYNYKLGSWLLKTNFVFPAGCSL